MGLASPRRTGQIFRNLGGQIFRNSHFVSLASFRAYANSPQFDPQHTGHSILLSHPLCRLRQRRVGERNTEPALRRPAPRQRN